MIATAAMQHGSGRAHAWHRTRLALAVLVTVLVYTGDYAYAHRSECHRWHACPADQDVYMCGDLGYCAGCPDNRYCSAGERRAANIPGEATPPQSIASLLSGEVRTVHDGDTITIVDHTGAWHRIRLLGIDAPERGQDYTRTSRDHLVSLIAGKMASVYWRRRDSYGRILGRVFVAGEDVGLAQVHAGMAWYDDRHARELGPQQHQRYAAAQTQAQAARAGLWIYRQPMPPWEWARSRR